MVGSKCDHHYIDDDLFRIKLNMFSQHTDTCHLYIHLIIPVYHLYTSLLSSFFCIE